MFKSAKNCMDFSSSSSSEYFYLDDLIELPDFLQYKENNMDISTTVIGSNSNNDISIVFNDDEEELKTLPAQYSVHPTLNNNNNSDYGDVGNGGVVKRHGYPPEVEEYEKNLPIGFRFCPRNNELKECYLRQRINGQKVYVSHIVDEDVYLNSPDVLTGKYPPLMGKKEWYFFTPRNSKSKNGSRPKRSTGDGSGYWMATCRDDDKRVLVYYKGNHRNNEKTDWLMHEYYLPMPPKSEAMPMEGETKQLDIALCRIYQKGNGPTRNKASMRDATNNGNNEDFPPFIYGSTPRNGECSWSGLEAIINGVCRSPPAQFAISPGYRFSPTDGELVYYLREKIWGRDKNNALQQKGFSFFNEADIYQKSPDQLTENLPLLYGKMEWYIFTPRDKKYQNGKRPSRTAGDGYWKANGSDQRIIDDEDDNGGREIGYKKVLTYHKGKQPHGDRTDWIMHEYLIPQSDHPPPPATNVDNNMNRLDEVVLCRIYYKAENSKIKTTSCGEDRKEIDDSGPSHSSHLDDRSFETETIGTINPANGMGGAVNGIAGTINPAVSFSENVTAGLMALNVSCENFHNPHPTNLQYNQVAFPSTIPQITNSGQLDHCFARNRNFSNGYGQFVRPINHANGHGHFTQTINDARGYGILGRPCIGNSGNGIMNRFDQRTNGFPVIENPNGSMRYRMDNNVVNPTADNMLWQQHGRVNASGVIDQQRSSFRSVATEYEAGAAPYRFIKKRKEE